MATTHSSGPLSVTVGYSDFSQFVGLGNILATTAGTWTKTWAAAGNYSYVHTAAAETATLGIDITPQLRAASAKGFELVSIRLVHSNGTAALVSHVGALYRVVYANSATTSITAVPLTGTLPTTFQAADYVTELTVTTPAFLNTANAKYVFEITAQFASSSDYKFKGLILTFARNDL